MKNFILSLVFVYSFFSSGLAVANPSFCSRALAQVVHRVGAIVTLGQLAPPPMLRGIPGRGNFWGRSGIFLPEWLLVFEGSSAFGGFKNGSVNANSFLVEITPEVGSRVFRTFQKYPGSEEILRKLVPQVEISFSGNADPNDYMEVMYADFYVYLSLSSFPTKEDYVRAVRIVYEFLLYGPSTNP